ncbi:hypothetical protein GSI_12231 [Ganoderma sinense ZZ0214-1]|uniref:BTB domain-containing protein n=1 Tax=Ganoderma sinense ZZ0214-1 TaxID=1077348 RepID=A0A2G8RY77_9APHY|nr:hypothetical protein GSI_12231 [Ganoderma sinense ZZ0214-1]
MPAPAAHDNPPLKRPRTSESEPLPLPSTSGTTQDTGPGLIVRHSEELWFGDGNVILAARHTGFRVFRSLLATQSTVFAEIFASSSSGSDPEIFEGCPVVRVSDTPEDIAHFLRVLLPTSQRILFSRKFSFSFHQISAIIRLAHKYNVLDICNQAIASLQDHFTTDFAAWDRGANEEVIKVRFQQSIGVVNLARLVDRPALLPTAFYKCALLGCDVLAGYRREDKSIEHLSPEDLKRCINGRNKLVEEAFAILLEVFVSRPCDECTTDVVCRTALQRLLEVALVSCKQASASVLQGWDDLIQECAQEWHLCAACVKTVLEREYQARKRVWDALPVIFDVKVDGWPSAPRNKDGDAPASANA